MVMSVFSCAAITTSPCHKLPPSPSKTAPFTATSSLNFAPKRTRLPLTVLSSLSSSIPPAGGGSEDPETESPVDDLRVPENWSLPHKALEESEWLRVTLHKWLDDEYCPEATNVEISQVAASSYYESLMGNERDLGVILLRMATRLESISYQESFHGAFSSANAAVNLIAQRIEQED